MERLKREHADRLAKLKAEGEARVREVYQRHQKGCEDWDLRQQFRREEERIRQQNDDAVKLAYRRTARTYRRDHAVLALLYSRAPCEAQASLAWT